MNTLMSLDLDMIYCCFEQEMFGLWQSNVKYVKKVFQVRLLNLSRGEMPASYLAL